jgi:hypothetical protein
MTGIKLSPTVIEQRHKASTEGIGNHHHHLGRGGMGHVRLAQAVQCRFEWITPQDSRTPLIIKAIAK